MNWAAEFALPRRPIYLNCAAQGPLPRVALSALDEARRLKAEPHRIDEDIYVRLPDGLRRSLARLIGCTPGEIALGTGASHGLNLAANGLRLAEGDEVVMPRGEFPAGEMTFRFLERRGVVVRSVPPRRGAELVDEDDLLAALGPRTRVLSVSWVHYVTGHRLDLARLGSACRERGVVFVVDGTQGVGALPLDLRTVHVDVLACAAFKWLLGPYGAGFVYVRRALLDRLDQRDLNWMTVRDCDDLGALAGKPLELDETARRFDAPESASFFNVTALKASVDFVTRARPARIFAHVDGLLARLVAGLPRRWTLVSSREPRRRSTIVALRAASPRATQRRVTALRRAGFVLSLREDSLRLSPHVYNDARQIDRLLEHL